MYDAIIAFCGNPPADLDGFIYLAAVAFSLYLIDQAYTFLRVLLIKGRKHD